MAYFLPNSISRVLPQKDLEDIKNKKFTNKQFGQLKKYFKESYEALHKLSSYTFACSNVGLTIDTDMGEEVLKMSDINIMYKILGEQMDDLHKIYCSKKRNSGPVLNTRFKDLFYVTDQYVNFFRSAKLDVLELDGEQVDVSKEIDILTEKRMATTGMMVSLFPMYIRANSLKQGGGYRLDDKLKELFKSTEVIFKGKNLSSKPIPGTLPEPKQVLLKEKKKLAKLSVYERLGMGKEEKYSPDTFFKYKTVASINQMFRCHDYQLTEEQRSELRNQDNIDSALETQTLLTAIKQYKLDKEKQMIKDRRRIGE
jgi:hypothetical protein